MPAVRRQRIRMGTKGARRHGLHRRVHLTPEAAQKIDKVLNGHSPVYYCNWMDIASHTPEYNYTKTWHYLNIDEGQTLETMPRNPRRRADGRHDARRRAQGRRAGTRGGDRDAQDADPPGRRHALPDALGHRSDRGGNTIPVTFFGKPANLHSIWDTSAARSRSQMELHRVAESDRPVVGRRGDAHRERYAERVVHGDGRAVQGEIYEATPEGRTCPMII